MSVERDAKYQLFVGRVSIEDDGGWTREVWDAAWFARQEEVDALQQRIKLLEEEVAFVEHGYNQAKGEGK